MAYPSVIITGCRNGMKDPPEQPLRLFKAVPAIYVSVTDSGLSLHGDTVYKDGRLFTGFLIDKASSGSDSVFTGSYFDGLAEGRHAKWYPNGVMSEERFYINGKKEGLHRGWWPDGKPRFRFTCYDNEFEGKFEEWNDSGLLIKKFHYSQGYEKGAQKLWWSNGKIRANYVVRDGRKYGLIGLKLCSNPYDSSIAK